MSSQDPAKYYVIEDGVPIPQRKNLVKAINSLKEGQSFIVPTSRERGRAISLARTRKIVLVSQKVEDEDGNVTGYRLWRQVSER